MASGVVQSDSSKAHRQYRGPGVARIDSAQCSAERHRHSDDGGAGAGAG